MTTYFTKDHEWIAVDGDTGTVGVTDYAQQQLGDVVFVELPDVGKELAQGDEAAVVESVKAASEVYAPVTGTVAEVNSALEGEPALVNSSAEADGWFLKLTLSNKSELDGMMDADGYKKFVADLG